MYIYDCLYGKIEFPQKIIRCLLTPEMQRLREVRLGNINSLCLTGSANINRYEHSIGTAYLAMVNERENKRRFQNQDKAPFIYAALFHDLANGPFGHAYEYIVEKQGFVPEKSIGDVILGKTSGSHKKGTRLEPFYLGEPNEIGTVLSKEEIIAIDEIVSGRNVFCSKILSDVIDIDNIDNVYRMAFHMGIPIKKEIPEELAKSIICKDNRIFFRESAVPYLYDWYETRKKVYNLLLFNPQDFAAKCMLAEVMDAVLEKEPERIKWFFTDSDLIDALRKINEEYWDEIFVPIIQVEDIEDKLICEKLSEERTVKEGLNTIGIVVPEKAKLIPKEEDGKIYLSFYNTEYYYEKGTLYKKIRTPLNPVKTINRLMRGNLFACVGIYVTKQMNRIDLFSDYRMRRELEYECNGYLEKSLHKDYSIAFHAIVDKNKTNRQLEISLETGECFTIGINTQNLLIGAFLRNANYGLAKAGGVGEKTRQEISKVVSEFLRGKGIECQEYQLYSEVEKIGESNN